MFSCEIKLFVFSNSKFKIYNVIMYNVLVSIFLGTVSGVSCYNCSSTDDPLCADPFWGGSQFLIDCPHSCIKVKQSSTYRQICKLNSLVSRKNK